MTNRFGADAFKMKTFIEQPEVKDGKKMDLKKGWGRNSLGRVGKKEV